ncbi:DUF6234 family protein [Streptomyces sp. SCSIO 30461]|uniref:DUF6234 family protein n=1 Tax=Streptomyces sp. SCSIO 30461 TaxID=3118085 RepID=UPI0030CAB118
MSERSINRDPQQDEQKSSGFAAYALVILELAGLLLTYGAWARSGLSFGSVGRANPAGPCLGVVGVLLMVALALCAYGTWAHKRALVRGQLVMAGLLMLVLLGGAAVQDDGGRQPVSAGCHPYEHPEVADSCR